MPSAKSAVQISDVVASSGRHRLQPGAGWLLNRLEAHLAQYREEGVLLLRHLRELARAGGGFATALLAGHHSHISLDSIGQRRRLVTLLDRHPQEYVEYAQVRQPVGHVRHVSQDVMALHGHSSE